MGIPLPLLTYSILAHGERKVKPRGLRDRAIAFGIPRTVTSALGGAERKILFFLCQIRPFYAIPACLPGFRRIAEQGTSKVAVVTSVILSEAKNPIPSTETLRFDRGDKKGLWKGPGGQPRPLDIRAIAS